jgi:hypothetical protein
MNCTTGICGTGGPGPLPGDPDLSASVLSAVPVFGGIDVSWTYPAVNPHAVAHTLLYRGLTDDVNLAVELAVVAGNRFHDQVDSATQYRYWIRFVSVNGTLGDFIGPAVATAKPLIEDLIEQLTGEIDNGVLANSLKTKLDEISVLNAGLAQEILDRESGTVTLAQAIQDANDGVAQALGFLTTEIETRIDENAAILEAIYLQTVTLGDQIAAVQVTTLTAIDAVEGTVNAMYTAKLTVNGLVGGFGLANDGVEVEAGFDLETFWVGRTNADKIKPFIVSGGVVYIAKAAIKDADIDTLKIAGNAVTIPTSAYTEAGLSHTTPSSGSGTETVVIQSLSYTSTGNQTFVLFTASRITVGVPAPNVLQARYELQRNLNGGSWTTIYAGFNETLYSGAADLTPIAISLSDTPPFGIVGYRVVLFATRIQNDGGQTVSGNITTYNRSLLSLETKR